MRNTQGRLHMQQVKRNFIFQALAVWLVATSIILSSIVPAQAVGLSDLFNDNATQSTKADFLKVDQAFTVVPMVKGNTLTLSLEITPGYYLYKNKFALKLPQGVNATKFTFSQPAHYIDDPNFGRVQIFDQNQVTATATLTNTTNQAINQDAILTWQGCAKAGLCYPPQKQPVSLNLAAAATDSAAVNNTKAKSGESSTQHVTTDSAANSSTLAPDTKAKATKDIKTAKTEATQGVNRTKESKATDTTSNTQIVTEKESNTKKVVDTATQKQLAQTSNSNNTSINNSSDSSVESLSKTNLDEAALADASLNNVNDSIIAGSDQNLDIDSAVLSAKNDSHNSLVETDSATLNSNSSTVNATNNTFFNNSVVDTDPFGLATHPSLALALLFIAGLGLAFTPCILPMLPIVSNIIARQHKPSAKKGLLLSGSYALGVSVAYGLLGAAIAVFGQSLGIIGWLQNPVILIAFAIVFVILALYMLDIVKLSVPNKLKQKLQSYSQLGDKYLGSNVGSFIAGFLSALVVSPCVSAPLFGALLAVSTIGNPVLGFAALFMLGLGLSTPLMLLGATQGNLMPKAGAWMNRVKQGFALLLLGVALLLIARVLISPIMLILWATWFAIVASWMWHWQGEIKPFAKAIAFLLIVWTACLLVGAAAGSRDAWQPLAIIGNNAPVNRYASLNSVSNAAVNDFVNTNSNTSANTRVNSNSTPHQSDITITKLDDLMPILEQHDRVLVDVTAEWCIECRIMDRTLFTNRPNAMLDWQMVRLDITETNADSEQVLKQLRLFGPPALLYFVDGTLKVQQVGTVGRKQFENTLAKL